MVDVEVSARLADAVKRRRAELRMSQGDVVVAAKMAGHQLSTQTVTVVEQSKRDQVLPRTAEALEAALEWPAGYVASILGNEPPPARQDTGDVAALRDELAQLRGQVATLAGIEDVKSPDIRTVAAVIRMFSPEQRRVFAQALAVVEAES